MTESPDISTAAEAEENARLPRLHEVHSDPNHAAQREDSLPAALRTPQKKSAARWAYERLILYIRNFETTLDSDQEVAMGFVGGDAGVMRIEGLGYFDPDIVTFYGSDRTGAKTQLIQHVSQLNVLLRAAPKAKGAEESRRIGFRLARELDEADATS